MKQHTVTIVRIYITEGEHILKRILHYLKMEANIRGITVFRAISGYGKTGEHSSSLVELSLNLPLVIEFFDEPDKISSAIDVLSEMVKAEHIIFWQAETIL